MPGDSDVSGMGYETTLAITIDAPAPAIWPWLVQMGYRRGGLLPLRLARSRLWFSGCSERDANSSGFSSSMPVMLSPSDAAAVFRCGSLNRAGRSCSAARAMARCGYGSWASTRSTAARRGSCRATGRGWTVGWALFMCVLEPAAFIMTRRMLLGLKQRAEVTTTRQRAHVGSDAA